MTIVDALILGLVQGLTEFLPVSSSGHLILAREALGLSLAGGLAFDAVLHFATALAVIWYFWKDLWGLARSLLGVLKGGSLTQEEVVLLGALGLGTVPAVILGLWWQDSIETVFRSAELVAWALLIGSLVFVVAELVSKRYSEPKPLTIKKGVLIGFFQALALVPGMSRSGSTISGALLLGLSRESTARFAFLLSLPVILGAGSLKALQLGSESVVTTSVTAILVGSVVAFLSGLLAIHFLIRFLKNHTLYWFVGYRVVLASLVFWLL